MITFDEEKHKYYVDGEEYPSVTHICRFLSVDTAVNADKWQRDLAALRGTAVHEATVLLDYAESIDEDFPAEWKGYVTAYMRFLADFKPEWELIEKPMAHSTMQYAGTLDRYGTINGKKTVLDMKTTAKLNHFTVAMQLAGYTQLLLDNGYEVESQMCLQLDKGGTYELFELDAQYPFSLLKLMHDKSKNYKGVRI